MIVHPLLRFALFLCPPEFRRRFGAQITADQKQYHGLGLLGAFANIAIAGLEMRFENLARDLGFAFRSLAKAPGYASVAILAFGLAIGANVAVASVLDAVVLRPMPFPNGDRLVMVSQGQTLATQISYRNARDIEARNHTLSGIGLVRENGATLTGRGRPVYLPGWTVDETYFSVLGVRAQLGRTLGPADLGTSNVVISNRIWQRNFSSNPRVIGQVLQMDGHDYRIVGVMPPGFNDPAPAQFERRDYWVAVDKHSILAGSRLWTGFHGVARLADGMSVEAARADITRILDADAAKYPHDFIDARGATVIPLLQAIVGNTSTLLWMLYAAVAMVLLIACVNIANLTIARIGARERELVVRNALGAARARIVTQLMTELMVLAVAGGLLGAAIAYGMLSGLRTIFAQVLPRWENVGLNGHVLAYAALVVAGTAILTGLLPVLARSDDMTVSLKSGGRSGDRGTGGRMRAGLVVIEVALAVAVVVSAGLVLRSFITLTHTDVGFKPRNLSLLLITLPYNKYYSDPNAAANASNVVTVFSHRVVGSLRATPGIVNAAAAIIVPFGFNTYPRAFTIPGQPDPHATVTTNAISRGFFTTMEIPLLRGRDFGNRDTSTAPATAIVNASFARRFFGTENVIGKQVALTPFVSAAKAIPQTIVGVVGDTRTSFSRPPEPQLYVPFDQIPLALFYVVRTADDRVPLAAIASKEIQNIDPAVASPSVQSFGALLSRDAVRSQAAMLLFGILALLALILSLAGIYAVTAYSVERRTQEFGVRQAVGAAPAQLLRDVLRGAVLQSTIGIAAGIALAAVFTRFLAGLLFDVSPLDATTFLSVIAVTLLAVVIAAVLPALRAARVQPASAIRYE